LGRSPFIRQIVNHGTGYVLINGRKEMCAAKVKEAVQLINEKWLDAAIAVINRKDGGSA